MFDFDFNFDIDIKKQDTVVSCERFNLLESIRSLKTTNLFPKQGESIRFLSPKNGFSSCSVVCSIADKIDIDGLIITTLRVGSKELQQVCNYVDNGKINKVFFCLCDIARENKKYNYDTNFESICNHYGFGYKYKQNHSKLILLNTKDEQFITIETSSNFNENPKIEQFCIVNSKEVYDFYIKELKKVGILDA